MPPSVRRISRRLDAAGIVDIKLSVRTQGLDILERVVVGLDEVHLGFRDRSPLHVPASCLMFVL